MVKSILLLSAVFLMVTVGIFFIHLTLAVDRTSLSIQQSLTHLTKDADDAKVMANAALFQAEETLHEVSDMARTEKAAQKSQLTQVNKVLDQLTLTLQHVDTSQVEVSASITPVLVQLQSTLAQTQETVKSMNAVVQDPNIPATLNHINGTMANLQSTSKSVDDYVKKITTPRGFMNQLWHGLLGVAGLGASASQIVR